MGGRFQTGILKKDTMVTIAPHGLQDRLKNVEVHGCNMEDSLFDITGLNATFFLKHTPADEVAPGIVLGDADNDPPKETMSFDAQV